jgi:hypothetical protein
MPFTFDPSTGEYQEVAAPARQGNPFQLFTEPGPGREFVSMEGAISHMQDLEAQYTANDTRIADLEQRLVRGRSMVQRPPWARGRTDAEIEQIARSVGRNPNQEAWWQGANLRPGTLEYKLAVLERQGGGGQGTARFTGQTSSTTAMRRELKQLRAANDQIMAATDHLMSAAEKGATFYRAQATLEELPFAAFQSEPAGTNPPPATAGDRAAAQRQALRRAEAARKAAAAAQVTERGLVQPAAIRRALDQVINAQVLAMRATTQDLIDGRLTIAQWQRQMMRHIKATHLVGLATARGGWESLDQSAFGWVGQRVRLEYKFLRGFAADLASGKQALNGTALTRAGMYAEAGRQTHRAAEQRAALGRGQMEERNRLGAADHCPGCLTQTSRGWQPIGSLVPCGLRECRVRCHCSLQFRASRAA